ncbi:hypothetical protein FE697_013650 [Mumia zhuanghuii]|uniref:Tetratricopeptide repeat-containing protein n=2 Tax=Mumia TaxID=1546255 RepID=A0ABW1QNW2_9ACTN|nr:MULTISPECIES: hypothetical protein [Mumia]KAA1422210.1 hypothetical protein FE697_013650 [Mumia zhuanghuii]
MTEATATPDPVMQRVTEAVTLGHQGDRDGARAGLQEVWDQIGAEGDPFHRCVVAHYLADVTPDPQEELRWDERALAAAHETTDARAQEYDSGLAVAGFFPSLHLNLADVLRRLGRFDEAAVHAEHAAARIDILPDDGYASTIREALAGVRYAIAARDTSARESSPSS